MVLAAAVGMQHFLMKGGFMNHGPDYRGRATGFVQVKAIEAVMVQMWTSSQTMMAAELIGKSMSEAVDAKERHRVPVSPVRLTR